MQKLIFLDIDGVMNHDDWYYNNRVVNKVYKCGDIDPNCVKLLNKLTNCEIVISSSWGEDADKPLKSVGLKLPIIGHIDNSLSYKSNWICRGNCIAKWIYDNDFNLYFDDTYKYVIFDDDKDMLLSQYDNFVWVDGKHGLTQEHIDKARKILE